MVKQVDLKENGTGIDSRGNATKQEMESDKRELRSY